MKISFIGLGKLGLPLACCLASGGNQILGIDKNGYVNSKLRAGEAPFYENGLEEILRDFRHNFMDFSNDFDRAIKETDVSIILVNTQIGDTGYAIDFVEDVILELAHAIQNSSKPYHTIIVSSTLLPGSMQLLVEKFENVSGRKLGESFGIAYVPDFVRLGMVLKDFVNPEFVLIGAKNERDYNTAATLWQSFVSNLSKFHWVTLKEAEIAKVALNAYLVNKITFANFLGLLCEGIEDVNVHNVTKVIGLDKRISPFFFRSGAPFGGTCFPRDTAAFIEFTRLQGFVAEHMHFAEKVNKLVLNEIIEKSMEAETIAILGLSFKEGSPVTTGSPSVLVAQELLKKGKTVFGFDPLSNLMTDLPPGIQILNSAEECVKNAQLLVLMHLDVSYSSLSLDNVTLVDPWLQV
jgi:UDPglucose 6-dehydrogenase